MKNEHNQILHILEKRIESSEQFDFECCVQEIEWNLAQGLKKYRISLNISQEEVAQRSGLTRQMVSRVETFSYTPNVSTLIKYLYALGVDLSAIINNLSLFQEYHDF